MEVSGQELHLSRRQNKLHNGSAVAVNNLDIISDDVLESGILFM
jgi:hypothetical protein